MALIRANTSGGGGSSYKITFKMTGTDSPIYVSLNGAKKMSIDSIQISNSVGGCAIFDTDTSAVITTFTSQTTSNYQYDLTGHDNIYFYKSRNDASFTAQFNGMKFE